MLKAKHASPPHDAVQISPAAGISPGPDCDPAGKAASMLAASAIESERVNLTLDIKDLRKRQSPLVNAPPDAGLCQCGLFIQLDGSRR